MSYQEIDWSRTRPCFEERFRCKYIVKVSEIRDECWEWIGVLSWNGYGSYHVNTNKGRCTGAHRISYLLYRHDIPDGMDVCHSCDNRKCVNPHHLWLGTRKQNIGDMVQKKRENPHKRNIKFCPKGHEYTKENTVTTSRKWRHCRTCAVEATRRWNKRQKEKKCLNN